MPASVAGTTSPLAANGVWTSPWHVRLPHHRLLEGSVFADVGGTIHIQQASGTDASGEFIPDIDAEYEVTSEDGAGIEETLKCRRWRIVYENGSSKQATFRVGVTATPTEPPR